MEKMMKAGFALLVVVSLAGIALAQESFVPVTDPVPNMKAPPGEAVTHVIAGPAGAGEIVKPQSKITIEKNPERQILKKGETTAEWFITVKNTGNVELGGIMVTDEMAPDCNYPKPDPNTGVRPAINLKPGDTITIHCQKTDVRKSFTNVAVVSALAPSPIATQPFKVLSVKSNKAYVRVEKYFPPIEPK